MDIFEPSTYYVIIDTSTNNEVVEEFDNKNRAVQALYDMEKVSGTTYVVLERTDRFVVSETPQTVHIQLPDGWEIHEDGTLSIPEGYPKMRVIESDARVSPEFAEWLKSQRNE